MKFVCACAVIPVPGESSSTSSVIVFPGDILILECLIDGSMLAPGDMVMWTDDFFSPLASEGLQFACSHDETLILTNVMRSQTVMCLTDTFLPIGSFFISFMGEESQAYVIM